VKIVLQHYADARSLYRQEGRQDKGRKTAPRAGARDSVMSGCLLISGRHLWPLMSGHLLISGRHLILTTRDISTQRFLHAVVPEIMPVDRSTTPKQIVKAVQHAFHQTIPYQQAKRTLNTLQRNDIDLEHEQFRQLSALIQILMATSSSVLILLRPAC